MSANSLEDDQGQWPKIAATFLHSIGHPLRPIPEDVLLYGSFLLSNQNKGSKALVLGVTPELHALASQLYDEVFAIDRTKEMIDFIWPGKLDNVFQKDWLELELLNVEFDAIFLDGGLHLLRYPDQQSELIKMIGGSLKPEGRFVTRLFSPPVKREDVGDVLCALKCDQIPSMNHLKVRLANALQKSAHSGVRLADVWRELTINIGDRRTLFDKLGWQPEHVGAIDFYRNSDARYAFVTVEQVVSMTTTASSNLEFIGVTYPSYFMSHQFPVICFEKAP